MITYLRHFCKNHICIRLFVQCFQFAHPVIHYRYWNAMFLTPCFASLPTGLKFMDSFRPLCDFFIFFHNDTVSFLCYEKSVSKNIVADRYEWLRTYDCIRIITAKEGNCIIMEKDKKITQWSERIHEFQSSGQTCKTWCQEHRIPVSIMNYWMRKLKTLDEQSDTDMIFAKMP